MNIKRFCVNAILGIILMNGIPFLIDVIRDTSFHFDWFFGLVTPVLAGLASAMVRTPEERRQLR